MTTPLSSGIGVLIGQLLRDDAEGLALVPATSYGFAVAATNLVAP